MNYQYKLLTALVSLQLFAMDSANIGNVDKDCKTRAVQSTSMSQEHSNLQENNCVNSEKFNSTLINCYKLEEVKIKNRENYDRLEIQSNRDSELNEMFSDLLDGIKLDKLVNNIIENHEAIENKTAKELEKTQSLKLENRDLEHKISMRKYSDKIEVAKLLLELHVEFFKEKQKALDVEINKNKQDLIESFIKDPEEYYLKFIDFVNENYFLKFKAKNDEGKILKYQDSINDLNVNNVLVSMKTMSEFVKTLSMHNNFTIFKMYLELFIEQLRSSKHIIKSKMKPLNDKLESWKSDLTLGEDVVKFANNKLIDLNDANILMLESSTNVYELQKCVMKILKAEALIGAMEEKHSNNLSIARLLLEACNMKLCVGELNVKLVDHDKVFLENFIGNPILNDCAFQQFTDKHYVDHIHTLNLLNWHKADDEKTYRGFFSKLDKILKEYKESDIFHYAKEVLKNDDFSFFSLKTFLQYALSESKRYVHKFEVDIKFMMKKEKAMFRLVRRNYSEVYWYDENSTHNYDCDADTISISSVGSELPSYPETESEKLIEFPDLFNMNSEIESVELPGEEESIFELPELFHPKVDILIEHYHISGVITWIEKELLTIKNDKYNSMLESFAKLIDYNDTVSRVLSEFTKLETLLYSNSIEVAKLLIEACEKNIANHDIRFLEKFIKIPALNYDQFEGFLYKHYFDPIQEKYENLAHIISKYTDEEFLESYKVLSETSDMSSLKIFLESSIKAFSHNPLEGRAKLLWKKIKYIESKTAQLMENVSNQPFGELDNESESSEEFTYNLWSDESEENLVSNEELGSFCHTSYSEFENRLVRLPDVNPDDLEKFDVIEGILTRSKYVLSRVETYKYKSLLDCLAQSQSMFVMEDKLKEICDIVNALCCEDVKIAKFLIKACERKLVKHDIHDIEFLKRFVQKPKLHRATFKQFLMTNYFDLSQEAVDVRNWNVSMGNYHNNLKERIQRGVHNLREQLSYNYQSIKHYLEFFIENAMFRENCMSRIGGSLENIQKAIHCPVFDQFFKKIPTEVSVDDFIEIMNKESKENENLYPNFFTMCEELDAFVCKSRKIIYNLNVHCKKYASNCTITVDDLTHGNKDEMISIVTSVLSENENSNDEISEVENNSNLNGK